jgi:hypothetical protein
VNIKLEFDKVNSKLDRLEKLIEALNYPAEPLELYKVNKSVVEVSEDGGRKNTKSSNRSSK